MAAEDGKQAEDLDAEEGEREDVRGAGQARRQHRAGHEGGVGREGGGELDADAAAVVEEEDVDAHEPAAHGPDGVAGCGLGEGFQDGGEAEEGAVDQDGRFGRGEPLLVARGEGAVRGVVGCGVVGAGWVAGGGEGGERGVAGVGAGGAGVGGSGGGVGG